MSTSPLQLSVVIPSLNQGRYLGQCLDSILEQRYPHTQIIVIDGGSTDETVEVLDRYAERIAFRVSEPDRGQSHALNKGFAHATGDIVTWQNADDFYLPGAFGPVTKAFERHPDAPLVYGDWIDVDEHGDELVRWYAFPFSDRSIRYQGTSAIAQAMFWRHEVHERFGEFPEQLHQLMDHYLTIRIGLNEGYDRFHRIDQPIMAFRRHPDQKTGHLDRQLVAAEVEELDRLVGTTRRGGVAGTALRWGYKVLKAMRYWRRGGTRYLMARLRDRLK